MDKFVLHSNYKPTGDQPQAIDKLVKGLENGLVEYFVSYHILCLKNAHFMRFFGTI